ncbi:hypothetical protein [Litoribrevibacter albus]|uniref:Uncharacterized protein n=1 Tax=Litoribrevibacter albus TaxID=1473156 RepID=A0AA37W7F8_9GAMM|nr:hypothetical protein [Litoribrevibacter albus]GLQ31274.1 hypothetical protein GCM10007876_17530 [Litoribrevibacter albus]
MSSLVVLAMLFVVMFLCCGIAFLFWRSTVIQDRLHALENNIIKESNLEFVPHLKLVIHKPHKVAQRESRLAKAVSAVSPEYIKYRVYKQVAEELEIALNEREIDVSIELVGMKGSSSRGAKPMSDDSSSV